MESLGRTLIFAGLALTAVGVLLVWSPSIPLGRLPGDLRIERDGAVFYMPITTCLLLSAIASAVLWLLGRFR